MLIEFDRFQQWRGGHAESERKYYSSAVLLDAYVDSVANLQVISADFAAGVESVKFKEFDLFEARNFGALLFLKLVVDESLAQLVEDEKNTAARAALVSVNIILSNAYENKRPDLNITIPQFFECIQKIIDLNNLTFMQPNQEQRLLFALDTCFRLILTTIDTLTWYKLTAANLLYSVDKLKNEINICLSKIEIKVKKINFDLEHPEFNALDALQHAFNQRYINRLMSPSSKNESTSGLVELTSLEVELNHVSQAIAELIESRRKQVALNTNIQMISELLKAVQENNQLVTGRLYFLDLIKKNENAYNLLMRRTQETNEGVHFIDAVTQLNEAVDESYFSLRMTHFMSKVSAPVTELYRNKAPQIVQNIVDRVVPATYDSACKKLLMQLAANHLADLKEQLLQNKQEIAAISTELFSDNDELKLIMDNEPVESFDTLLTRTKAMKDAIQKYNELYASIKENWEYFYRYQNNAEHLGRFIEFQHTYFVAILSFLARFFSIFNTDTVQLINKAKECKQGFELLGERYKAAVRYEISQIDKEPTFHPDMKARLKKDINDELVTAVSQNRSSGDLMNRRSTRILINSSLTLFATKPSPRVSVQQLSFDEAMRL